ncbi:cutinase family protein [Mycolicibacterium parafortuitum]|uniref:Cutinase n=1 Tax=Mycolicibacterium parafortuitum TaxID=39692 RepID=A0A375YD21_MYCPF|nr:cutinase family protein [Mycolicibacterium parafortuitum]ORB30992.1 cutinase family protein [Mycolicibacterium parafortuitum]SRX79001.1 putative cutinase [Mycolicibacterium parafortuitum]
MNRIGRWLAGSASVLVTAAGAPVVAAPAYAAPCPDVQVVFARGTFEPPGVGATGQAFVDAVRARAGGRSVDVYPVNYPASLDFATAAQGVIDAGNHVTTMAGTCPDTEIVLGGYSQGAAVAAYLTEDGIPEGYTPPPGLTGPMPPEVADHVAAVALFGKPSSGFLQMIYTGAPPITVGPRYAPKTVDLCVTEDPVCSPTGGDNAAHGAYLVNGMTDRAADYVVGRLPAPKPGAPVDLSAGTP